MPLENIEGITKSTTSLQFVLHVKKEKSYVYDYKHRKSLIRDLMIALFNKTGEKLKVWYVAANSLETYRTT